MNRRRRAWLAIALLALSPLACHPPAPTADQWLQRAMTAHGAAAHPTRVTSASWKGHIVAMARRDHGDVTIRFQRPRHLHVALDYAHRHEERLLAGSRGWRGEPGALVETTGPSLAAMVFQYKHLDMLFGVDDGTYRVSTYRPRGVDDGLPRLLFEDDEGPPMIVTIAPETGLISGVEGIIHYRGAAVRLAVEYHDYRPVDGRLLPHRIVNVAAGSAVAESRFDEIVLNGEGLRPPTTTPERR